MKGGIWQRTSKMLYSKEHIIDLFVFLSIDMRTANDIQMQNM